jgi:hypothetical protein
MTSSTTKSPLAAFTFSGFLSPNYTQIPDQFFDELMPILSGNETKVLLYIFRRTFGFKKETDNISLSQMVSGITGRDGTQLDSGTGLSKASVARALKDLEDKNVIVRVRRSDPQKGDLPTTYQLNMVNQKTFPARGEWGSNNSDTPRVSHRDTPLSHVETPRVSHRDTQETVLQQTVTQETENTTTKGKVILSEKDAVVANLVSFGISQKVSENLSERFSQDYIGEKIDFLQFKLDRESLSVKRPAAWLRKAIEDDYTAPDGYISPKERERQESEEKRRKQLATEAQKAHLKRTEQLQNEQHGQKVATLKKLFSQYRTSASDLALWTQAQEAMTYQGISAAISSSLQLLKTERENAVLYVSNDFVPRLIKPEVREKIEKILSDLAKRPLTVEFMTQARGGEGQMG